jgi:hypothetical protein
MMASMAYISIAPAMISIGVADMVLACWVMVMLGFVGVTARAEIVAIATALGFMVVFLAGARDAAYENRIIIPLEKVRIMM